MSETGLFIRQERPGKPGSRALSWYGEPFGRIYRDPHRPEFWLSEVWDGRQKVTNYQGYADHFQAATMALQKWAEATRTDLLAARYS